MTPNTNPLAWTSAFASFASASWFCLAGPGGVLMSATTGLLNTLVNLFLGTPPNPAVTEAELEAALDSTLQSIQSIVSASGIKQHIDDIKTEANWLDTKLTVINDLGDMDSATPVVQSIVAYVNSDVDVGNGLLLDAINSLSDTSLLADPSVGDQAYQGLLFGTGLYLTYLRLRVQMQSWLNAAAKPTSTSIDFSYDDFDTFRVETLKWSANIGTALAALRSGRLGQISAPTVVKSSSYEPFGENSGQSIDTWNFKDAGPRPPAAGPVKVAGWAGANHTDVVGTAFGYPSVKSAQPDCQAEHDAYVAMVNQAFDQAYADGLQGVAAWQNAIADWATHLTPKVPQDATPTLVPDAWGGTTPNGPNWVAGATVSYAVSWVNSCGASPLGPWSDPIAVTGSAFPTINVPVDPMMLAQSRHVQRRFGNGAPQVVGIVPDNQTTTFQDKTP